MPKRAANGPLLSVIVPTRDRARLLRGALASLARQTFRKGTFEVVVVDDGSTDDTPEVCRRAARTIELRYVRIDPAGISAAKNIGIFVASAPLLVFFDDDDVASGDLLARHLETHRAHPAEHVAVLGYTTWAPRLRVTALMHYVTDVGGFLFSYGSIRHGQWLDYTYFWGGRSSCKRALLTQHGIFNQAFPSIIEDIELGYRLTRFNLQIIHNRKAVQFMNRAVSYDDFCARCERQGRVLVIFSRLHAEAPVQKYCQVTNARERWSAIEPRLTSLVERVRELEATLARPRRRRDHAMLDELHGLYRSTFEGFKVKGMVEALEGDSCLSGCFS